MIPFNRQDVLGNELDYIRDAFNQGKISGDGKYTKLCSDFIQRTFKANHTLLTTSCTHALELAGLLLNIEKNDEIIMPSFTFVSTANAFVLRGAKPIFCDIAENTLNIDENLVESLINKRTKAIVPVHYAGVSCNMDALNSIAKEHGLYLIEDAAQGVNAKYGNRFLGTIGDIGCYSFHETKNYSMGEGGAIIIKDDILFERAEIIREKGTNRSKFFRGEVDKYTWVDLGSSYLPSDINAAILWAQLEQLDVIQNRRKLVFDQYYADLTEHQENGLLRLPHYPENITPNYHLFYIILNSEKERNSLIDHLRQDGIHSVFHYMPLHQSPYYLSHYDKMALPITERISKRLLRLPLFPTLTNEEAKTITQSIHNWIDGGKEVFRSSGITTS